MTSNGCPVASEICYAVAQVGNVRATWRLRSGTPAQMALSFPNPSRCFEPGRRAVRFWGHDSAIETSFFVTESLLRRIQPDMQCDEAGFLRVFDLHRDLICSIAAKVYSRGRQHSYDLSEADF